MCCFIAKWWSIDQHNSHVYSYILCVLKSTNKWCESISLSCGMCYSEKHPQHNIISAYFHSYCNVPQNMQRTYLSPCFLPPAFTCTNLADIHKSSGRSSLQMYELLPNGNGWNPLELTPMPLVITSLVKEDKLNMNKFRFRVVAQIFILCKGRFCIRGRELFQMRFK